MKIYNTRKEVIEDHIHDTDTVLDVGFWGQAVRRDDPDWLHTVVKKQAGSVYGVDLEYDESQIDDPAHYQRASAENFAFDEPKDGFDVIYASELIEHLSNPGLFLDTCRKHLKPTGKLVLTTPNAFGFVSMAEKFFKKDPSVNLDHTMYFNHVVLAKLLEKNGWRVVEQGFIDTLRTRDRSSLKRKMMYTLYRFVTLFTPKYMETIVVVAKNERMP